MAKINNAPRVNIFESVKNINVPQSVANLSYVNRLTCKMGYIYPHWYEDCVPSDVINAQAGIFARMMPTIAPIMQNIDLELRYFFVPYRILWENFEKYITGDDTVLHPYTYLYPEEELPELFDLFGAQDAEMFSQDYVLALNELPLRAYYKIWNEYFRDENIQNEVFNKVTDGNMIPWDEAILMKCDWRKDYFTSALPWTQRGNMAQFVGDVFMKKSGENYPLIKYLSNNSWTLIHNSNDGNQQTNGLTDINREFLQYSSNGEFARQNIKVSADADQVTYSAFAKVRFDPNETLAVAFGINELRMANAVQRFLERSALVGNRYSEYILGMFGVKCADGRLQRPEYLGGGRVSLQVFEVLQNEQAQLLSDGTPIDGTTPQGNLAGIGKISGYLGMNKNYFVPEYGICIGLMFIRPKASYMHGIRKYMTIGVLTNDGKNIDPLVFKTRLEQYYNPFFSHLGEEEIHRIELLSNPESVNQYGDFLTRRTTDNASIFGFNSRDAFRKVRMDEIHGDFKTTLKYWHLSRDFQIPPELNGEFLTCNPGERIFAVEDDSNKFLIDVYNKVLCKRPMPAYGTPML